ncbi:UDP-glucuronate 4-epimerase Gla, partial [Streptococcus pneumoniae]|nr:UDP-glucuronate 4-epimerase Gla [Streptococcus pneumoniae]
KTILITGVAGFIGSNLVRKLLELEGTMTIIGLDNLNDYYDIALKDYRLLQLNKLIQDYPEKNWIFIKGDIADKMLINKIFKSYHPQIVVNLAAQAGVRYSITNPDVYIESNIVGFHNVLEACRHSYEIY